jgi:hypothetical protein
MTAKLKGIKAELQRRKHHRSAKAGETLRQVLTGPYLCHAASRYSTPPYVFRRLSAVAKYFDPSQSARASGLGSSRTITGAVASCTPHPGERFDATYPQ